MEAGHLLLRLRRTLPASGDGSAAIGADGDRRSNDLLLSMLSSRFPEDAIVSEESADNRRRPPRRRAWIIDPLDGTREFGEPGRADWAVHVALVVDGVPVAGAVALPARGITLSTARPIEPASRGAGPIRLLVSRSRPPALVRPLAERLGATVVPMGSAGAKAMAVVLGEADVFVHAGGQYEWDTAAPVAVCLAAGLHASRIDGTPLRYNRPDPWLPDVLICTSELAEPVLGALTELTGRSAATEHQGGSC